VRNNSLTVLLISITASAASAQAAGPSGSDPKALVADPFPAQATLSSGSMTNAFQPGARIDEHGSFGLAPVMGELSTLALELRGPDVMAVDERKVWSLVDTDSIRVQREILFQHLDALRAETRGSPPSSPVYFGVGSDVKLVQHQEHQPGIPLPLGMSYPMRQKRWMLFTEFAPILDADPSTSLGWGGGVGIRLNFGR
jgi:hypothetical protein